MFIVQQWLTFGTKKNDPMYFESKQGVYTIAGLMQDFMGENYNNIVKYAVKKLNGYLAFSDFFYTTDDVEKEFYQ